MNLTNKVLSIKTFRYLEVLISEGLDSPAEKIHIFTQRSQEIATLARNARLLSGRTVNQTGAISRPKLTSTYVPTLVLL